MQASQTAQDIRRQIAEAVAAARETAPLVGSITNVITIDYVANAQLAVGGSAAMVYMAEEGEAMAGLCAKGGAVYINMGSLLPVHEAGVPATAAACAANGTPWVLDPVGIGIGTLRSRLLTAVRPSKPAVIRCNASEAIALAQLWGLDFERAGTGEGGVRGVDATDEVASARGAAVALARETGGAVAVSGKADLVTDGRLVATCQGGSSLLTAITGSGCSLGGVAAVYAAVSSPFVAALTATQIYNLAADRAATQADAPASFKVTFVDELFRAQGADVAAQPFELQEA